jgi:HPt (histidine-containing phosphotransfer) domain-containing protein/CheY-like chemotaxis protein
MTSELDITATFLEIWAINAVSVPQEIVRRIVPGKRFDHLLRRSLCNGMLGDIDVHETSSLGRQDHQHEQHPERHRGDREEIEGDQVLHVILQERLPRRRRRFPGPYAIPLHVMTAHALKGDEERYLIAGMDGYVAKPIKADDLFAIIDRLLRDKLAPDASPSEPPVDVPTALHSADGDKALLADVVEVFYQDYPGHVRALREAVSDNNAPQLERTAHSLKGALGTVGATIAYTLASELETMGRAVHLEGAGTALHKLEDELARIVAFFAEPDWAD